MKKLILALSLIIATLHANEVPHKRVYVDVVGDLMHVGHIAMFKTAKEHGDYLIVGVHSDEEVSSYKRLPIMNLEQRMEVIEACRYVDEVIGNAPLKITKEYIEEHQIELVIHGDDISEEKIQRWYGVPNDLGIFKTVPYTQGVSTTYLIDRVLLLHSNGSQ